MHCRRLQMTLSDYDTSWATSLRLAAPSRAGSRNKRAMALADIAYKATAGALGLATLLFAADLVQAMTKQAIIGKSPVRMLWECRNRHFDTLSAYACMLFCESYCTQAQLFPAMQPSADVQATQAREPANK